MKKEISVPQEVQGPETWSYDISVTAEEGVPVVDSMTGRVTNSSPVATFGPFTYDTTGEYVYTVTESGEVAGVTNDSEAESGKTVTVTVTDNKEGQLVATVTSTDKDPLTFINTYNYSATEAKLKVHKTLEIPEGLTGPEDITGKFEFTLSAVTEGAPMPEGTGNVVKNPDKNGGTAEFGTISFAKPGEYTYKIVESAGNVDGVENDTSEQTATVKVVDGRNGELKVDSITYSNGKGEAEFINKYSVKSTTASFL